MTFSHMWHRQKAQRDIESMRAREWDELKRLVHMHEIHKGRLIHDADPMNGMVCTVCPTHTHKRRFVPENDR